MLRSLKSNQSTVDPQNHTILIIDDTPANLKVIADFFTQIGFHVLVARNGASGLARAKHGQPDLILLDVLMPGIDGFECCYQLKQSPATCDIPVIFMTALTDEKDKVKGFQAGAVDYVTKPIQQEELLVRVTTHLSIRQLTIGLEQAVEKRTEELRETLQREKHLAHELSLALEAEKEISRFRSQIIEVVSHEFRTPITIIEQSNFLLKNHYEKLNVEKREQIHERISSRVIYIEKMLNDVALAYRNQLDEVDATLNQTDIQSIHDKLELLLQSKFSDSNRIVLENNASNVAIITDIELLVGTVFHLVSNALKFSDPPSEVRIKLILDENNLKMSVEDCGIGISLSEQDKVFDLFYRGSNIETRSGLGVGLHIAKVHASLLYGRLSLHSGGLDQGCTFTLCLPLENLGN